MSSVVETSLRLAACAQGRIHEISPRASLGRDDKRVGISLFTLHYPLITNHIITMSPKVRKFLQFLSYLLAMLAGSGMASCNFMDLGPIIY